MIYANINREHKSLHFRLIKLQSAHEQVITFASWYHFFLSVSLFLWSQGFKTTSWISPPNRLGHCGDLWSSCISYRGCQFCLLSLYVLSEVVATYEEHQRPTSLRIVQFVISCGQLGAILFNHIRCVAYWLNRNISLPGGPKSCHFFLYRSCLRWRVLLDLEVTNASFHLCL